MSALPNHDEPDRLDPSVRAEAAQIVSEPGYAEQVRQFRLAVQDETAYEGAASTREEIDRLLDLRP